MINHGKMLDTSTAFYQDEFSVTVQLDENDTVIPSAIKILSDTAVRGSAEYTLPIEDFFKDMPEMDWSPF
ncbi:MAG: hypothetical protein LBB94_12510 [Clostridiales bacterium]|jgi:hypothetical protein|nr:hypothetical protein [Clostridiales bacterium]